MKVIGMCGGSGSGKGTVCSLFLEYNIPSIDTDMVYRELTSKTSECLDSLVASFGDAILNPEGSLDRAKLASVVFEGEDSQVKLNTLNKIAHHYILDKTRKIITEYKNSGCAAVIVDAPVLFESGFDSECDIILAVIADRDKRIERIIARDNISKEKAEARINSQLSDDELISRSDIVVYNNGNMNELKNEISLAVNKIFMKKTI